MTTDFTTDTLAILRKSLRSLSLGNNVVDCLAQVYQDPYRRYTCRILFQLCSFLAIVMSSFPFDIKRSDRETTSITSVKEITWYCVLPPEMS